MRVTTGRDAGPPPTGQDRRLRQLLPALTVVVSTGGHTAEVERFAVTAAG